jgi:UPF0755 protein
MTKHTNVVLLILAILITSFVGVAYHDLYKPLALKQTLVFDYPPNKSARDIARFLKKNHLIWSETSIVAYLKFVGFSKQLKAGIYQLTAGETNARFISKIVLGEVLTKEFTIVAGITLKNLAEQLKKAEYLNTQELGFNRFKHSFNTSEGLFLADTYQYNAGSDAHQLLDNANDELNAALAKEWQNRDQQIPYKTPYELLIAASIIEKEASLAQERRLISGVIINRLKKKMRLQMDPTVMYGLHQDYQHALTKKDLKKITPFNTYRLKGLPPTPIAMVGRDALYAAAHPIYSDYLYYVAKGDGSHQFSVSYEQQRQAINKYQKTRVE